ncbi:MAG TPA: SDR family NAD(P)-dependent oxidoreductase [Bacteroidia bacterium]|nr:SDR family NAD(P)-dependent oxidoreductase [Bacteroidia bacterium]HNT80997.1 SDR family NAD(P)-dependent oxidoreductase [Bacteroidia bacterium]
MNKTILISGATSGFGEATARLFAQQDYTVIITGRRIERLNALANSISPDKSFKIIPLCFDVRSREDCFNAIQLLGSKVDSIDLLVNNAGLAAGFDLFEEASIDDWDNMIDTNVKGILYLTKACLPLLKKSDAPQIINIGSTAGKEVYQKGNVYCASKHAVDALSKAMRIDLLHLGIKVSSINPGLSETEFSMVRFKGDQQKAKQVYEGLKALQAQDIAQLIQYIAQLPPHVCLNDVTLTCLAQANSFYTIRK